MTSKFSGLLTPCLAAFSVLVGPSVAAGQAVDSPPVASAPQIEEAVAEARGLIQERLDQGLPAFSIAVAVDGEIIWREAMGMADIENGTAATVETRFRIGSTSKSIASALAGRLLEEGTIDLDADVRETLPEFPAKRWTLTLRDLLSNQAGVRHYRGWESRNRTHFTTVADGLSIFSADTLLFEPHSWVSYSSYGFNLAGAVMAAARGTTYGDLAATEIFEPLGMVDTAVDDPTVDMPTRATFYTNRGGEQQPAVEVDDAYKAPSGGIVSTPTDLVRFGSALLSGTTSAGVPWLNAETVEVLFTPRELADGRSTGYALGFRVQAADEEADPAVPYAVHHGGSSVGGRSMLLMLPDHGIVVSLLCNSDTYDTKEVDAAAIARSFREALGRM